MKNFIRTLTLAFSMTAFLAISIPANAIQPCKKVEFLSSISTLKNQTKTSALPLKKIALAGVRPGMSERQVRGILGQPRRIKNEDSPAVGKVRSLFYRDISINLVEDENKPGNFSVYAFSTKSRTCTTPDGIRVGDSRAKVIKTYGKAVENTEGKVNYLSYGIDIKDYPASFTFTIEGGRVTEISFAEQLT